MESNNPFDVSEIVQTLMEKIQTHYVFPDVAGRICTSLQMHLDQGEYSGTLDGELLAFMLTAHLQEVNQDKHLNVRWYADPLPDTEAAMSLDQEWVSEWNQIAKMDNYGVHKVERLPGNVGYLDIRGFSRPEWGGETAAAAMNFLANTSCLIIDLRKCMGGDPDMVALITSYLFGGERVHLNSLYWREGNLTEQYWTQPYVPGKRYDDKPVYVLTSKETFSGGEEFAYNLKTRQRATLVGENTGGGAHPGSSYRIHDHLDVFIPNGRAINPITGTNWEGCGVSPDVEVPQEQALNQAYGLALRKILSDMGTVSSRLLRLWKEEIEKALNDLGE